MKRLLLCIAGSLALTSCVMVDDFGTYWDKGFVDPALEGSWIRRSCAGLDSVFGPDEWRFTKNGASYTLRGIRRSDQAPDPDGAAKAKPENEPVLSARTLRIGRKSFLMQRDADQPRDGILIRYDVHGRTLDEYSLDNEAAVDFLAKRHPNATNIRGNTEEGRYVVIRTFDDDVFRILSEFVDDRAHWTLICQYRKTSK